MAEKNHIVPTQIISVAGYSLSVMLLAFACALYLGWLPHANKQENLASKQQAVPVVKSPDAPAKVMIAEEPQTTEKTEAETNRSSDVESEPSQTRPDVPTPPAAEDQQRPVETADVVPPEKQTPQSDSADSDGAGLIVLPNVTTQEPETKQAETEPQELPQPDVPERLTSQDTLTPEDLADTAESTTPGKTVQEPLSEPAPEVSEPANEDPLPAQPKRFAAEETPGETGPAIKVPGAVEPKPRAKPTDQANLQPPEPQVRIIVPPSSSPKPEPSPSVVIRIAPKDDEELEVLPRSVVSPKSKPKFIQQSERVVVRVPPSSEEDTREPSEAIVVPRKKPFRQAASDPAQPKVIVAPRTPSSKTDRTVRQTSNDAPNEDPSFDSEPAPKPMPKPRRLVRIPSHTASVAPRQPKDERATKRKRKVVERTAPAKVAKKRLKKQAPRKAKRRLKPVRNTIEGRRAERRPPVQTVSLDQDTYCLAMAIYYEAGRRNLQAQVIVARDILHRVESINFPDNVCDVVYQYAHRRGNCRYAFACDGQPDRPQNRTVWQRAKMLARAQISCGSRCGCYLQKPTLVSISAGRNRRVIRCQANYRGPAQRKLSSRDRGQASDLRIEPVASRPRRHAIGAIGRIID